MRNEYRNPLYDIAYHDTGFPHEHGGTATPTKTPPTPTPLAGYANTEDEMARALYAGQITYAEIAARHGEGTAQSVQAKANTLSGASLKQAQDLKKQVDAAKAAGQPVTSVQPAGSGATLINGKTQEEWDAIARAYDTGSPEANYGAAPRPAAPTAGSTSGGSAPAKPKPPVPNSLADLLARGALNVGGRPVLEGQQYIKPNEVVQAADGSWYVVDPQGTPVAGPFPNQTQANAANVYQNIGPAVTSNQYANIGKAAQAGANRQKVSAGSGQDASVGLDRIIQASALRGQQPGDFMGAANIPGAGVTDITRGGIPDYGGMRPVLDAVGQVAGGYTGRVQGPNGEIAVGQGAPIDQGSTGVGSQIWTVLAPYLSQSQINRIDPADYASIALAVNAQREAGQLQQADTAATKGNQAENYKLLTGQDPYDLDITPEPMAWGGQVMTGGSPTLWGDYVPAGDRLASRNMPGIGVLPGEEPTVPNLPPMSSVARDPLTQMPLGRGRQSFMGGGPLPVNEDASMSADLTRYMPWGEQTPWGGNFDWMAWLRAREEARRQQQSGGTNDMWRGLMADSPSWYTGPPPGASLRPDEQRRRYDGIGRREQSVGMAGGGNIVTGNEPMTVQGAYSGQQYATIGEPNALTGGQPTREVLNVQPLEPSQPMPVGNAPPSAFGALLEQLFLHKSKGRLPGYQKV